jgi:hypothetical protein
VISQNFDVVTKKAKIVPSTPFYCFEDILPTLTAAHNLSIIIHREQEPFFLKQEKKESRNILVNNVENPHQQVISLCVLYKIVQSNQKATPTPQMH